MNAQEKSHAAVLSLCLGHLLHGPGAAPTRPARAPATDPAPADSTDSHAPWGRGDRWLVHRQTSRPALEAVLPSSKHSRGLIFTVYNVS